MARQPRGAIQAAPPTPAPISKLEPAPLKLSGKMITVPRGGKDYRIPLEIYEGQVPDMTTQDVIAITEKAEQDKGDGALALDGLNQLLTMVDQLRAELNAERRARKDQDRLIAALSGAFESINTKVQVDASDELATQLAQLGAVITNAGAVRADLDASAERLRVERANTEQWFENETAALQQPVLDLRGTVKSSTTLMGERSADIENQLAAGESRQQRLDVQLQELGGQVEVIGNPPSRAEIRDMVTTEVTAEVNKQAPTLVDQAITTIRQDEFQGGFFGQRTDGDLTRRRRSDAANYQDPLVKA